MTFPSHSLSGTAPALFLRRWGPVATLFVLLLLVAWPVAAQVVAPGVTPDELAVRDTDLAKSLLTAIFGDMTEAATRSSMLGSAMFKYTSGVMIVSAALFIFVAFFGTLKTAEHGELMGRWSNVAVPFRFVVGATAMFPMASGYSLAQLLLMWLVGNGIGLANLLWVAAVDGYVAQQVVRERTRRDDALDRDRDRRRLSRAHDDRQDELAFGLVQEHDEVVAGQLPTHARDLERDQVRVWLVHTSTLRAAPRARSAVSGRARSPPRARARCGAGP